MSALPIPPDGEMPALEYYSMRLERDSSVPAPLSVVVVDSTSTSVSA